MSEPETTAKATDKKGVEDNLLKNKAETLRQQEKQLGKDHPLYKRMLDACNTNNGAEFKKALDDSEELKRKAPAAAAAAVVPRKPRFPVWNALWVIALTSILFILSLSYVNKNADAILAKHPGPVPNRYLTAEIMGGSSSENIANRILSQLNALQPDNVLFIGHQLAKKDIVDYLSALSQQAPQPARVRVLIGTDFAGNNQLSNLQSPLRQYPFTELRKAAFPINTQVLLAFNNQSHQALAFIGTYPFDIQDATRSEHVLVELHDFSECSKLFTAYNALLPVKP